MVKLKKIESDNMINLTQCKKNADQIDDAALEINSLIRIYEDADYYMKKNTSNDSTDFATQFYNESIKLRNIKNDLKQIAYKIRSKSQEIYNEELAEQQREEMANQS